MRERRKKNKLAVAVAIALGVGSIGMIPTSSSAGPVEILTGVAVGVLAIGAQVQEKVAAATQEAMDANNSQAEATPKPQVPAVRVNRYSAYVVPSATLIHDTLPAAVTQTVPLSFGEY